MMTLEEKLIRAERGQEFSDSKLSEIEEVIRNGDDSVEAANYLAECQSDFEAAQNHLALIVSLMG